jgi:ABC-type transport system involved in multi-copper enzyme maturation permease subunit
MLTQLRLLWRLHRWEVAFVIGGPFLLSLAMAIVAWQLDVTRDAVMACYEQPAEALSAQCRSAIEWGNTLGGAIGILSGAATVAPFAAGILLGAPLLSREIEHRTAPMAWSLSPSRPRWLAWRTIPLLVLLLAALLVLGQASALMLEIARERDLGFQEYGMFGPMLAARGLAVFGVGVLAGLFLGRVLPALLVTVLATVAIVGGMSIGRGLLMREEAEWIPVGDQADLVQMVFDQGFRPDAGGDVITWEEAFNRYPDAFDDMTGEGGPPGMTSVWKVVRPQAFGLYVTREIGVSVVVFLIAGVTTMGILRSRRPD